MHGDFILAADFGTTGVKVALVDHALAIRHSAAATYPLIIGGGGIAEQNPNDWWAAFGQAVAGLATEAGPLAGRIAAISFCAQTCGVVCADADGRPLRPALIWMDKRAAPEARRFVGGFPTVHGYNAFKGIAWALLANGAPSRNGMDPVCKMIWLRDREPETWRRTRLLLDVKDWLVLHATGNATTTGDSANLTWMMDTRRGREGWSPTLARMAGVPLDMLPPIVDGASVTGGLLPRAAAELGLDVGIPVLAGVSDVTAAALGSGATQDGQMHICIGSSSWIAGFHPSRVLSSAHSFATINSGVGNRLLLIATQESAGSALDWVGSLGGPNTAADASAVRVDDPIFVPWLAGERVPVDDDRMRGSFTGLSLNHDHAALRRSALEGVAFNLGWAHECVSRKLRGTPSDAPLPVVGGGALNRPLVRMLANTLERPLRLGRERFAGVSGAAAIGAAAVGWHADPWVAARVFAAEGGEIVEPDPDGVGLARQRRASLERLRPSLIRYYRRGV
jgi:xylulokinase